MSISTPSSSVAADKAASDAANAGRAVPLWGAAVVLAITAALGAWWAASDALPATAAAAAPANMTQTALDPRERCEGRHLIALHRCLARECEKPAYQAHRECRRVRDIEARARSVLGN